MTILRRDTAAGSVERFAKYLAFAALYPCGRRTGGLFQFFGSLLGACHHDDCGDGTALAQMQIDGLIQRGCDGRMPDAHDIDRRAKRLASSRVNRYENQTSGIDLDGLGKLAETLERVMNF